MSRIKHYELVPEADMLLVSFGRYLPKIEAKNNTYNSQYLDAFTAMSKEVREPEEIDNLLTKMNTSQNNKANK